MKDLEEAPMPAVEERVRDAFAAATDTITGQNLPGLPAPAGRTRMTRRWPGWLAPVAAGAAVAGVVIASLGISGVILHPARSVPANSARAFAEVPRYFAAIPPASGRAVIGATATGAVLGRIAPPEPGQMFTWVAAAGDSRTFVLGTSPRTHRGYVLGTPRPVRFYRLVLGRSGQLGRLTPLPIPPQTGISGLAVSPDGSKLAVSFPGSGKQAPRIALFTLATGAQRDWTWPGAGTIGQAITPIINNGLQWEADNRTLMFEVTTHSSNGWPAKLYLLNTAAAGDSLLASSTRIPLPYSELGLQHNRTQYIVGIPFISGDGSKLIAPFYRAAAPPKQFVFAITEFSVQTGKLIKVLYQRRTGTEAGSTAVWWVNTSGTAAIAVRGPVFGVQTATTFTPLPPASQRLLTSPKGSLHLLPDWG